MSSYADPGENNSLFLAPLCGIDIYVHAFLPYYALYRVFGQVAQYGSTGHNVWPFIIFNAIAVTILFGTVLIHEFGHSFMAIKLGGQVPKILLWPFGGLAYCSFSREIKNQLYVSMAGPAMHIPLLAFWMLLYVFTRQTGPECGGTDYESMLHLGFGGARYSLDDCLWNNVIIEGMMLQVMLFMFNVFLPIYPLDGGKIFICMVALCCKCEVPTLAKTCIGISSFFGLGLLGIAVLQQNYFMGFLCIWILYQVYNMYKFLSSGNIANHPLFEHMPGGHYNPVVHRERDSMGTYNRVGTSNC